MNLTPAHVRAARGLLKMTQAELAKYSGVSEVTIRKFENNQVRPTEDTLMRLQTVFEERRVRFFNGGEPGVRLVMLAEDREPAP